MTFDFNGWARVGGPESTGKKRKGSTKPAPLFAPLPDAPATFDADTLQRLWNKPVTFVAPSAVVHERFKNMEHHRGFPALPAIDIEQASKGPGYSRHRATVTVRCTGREFDRMYRSAFEQRTPVQIVGLAKGRWWRIEQAARIVQAIGNGEVEFEARELHELEVPTSVLFGDVRMHVLDFQHVAIECDDGSKMDLMLQDFMQRRAADNGLRFLVYNGPVLDRIEQREQCPSGAARWIYRAELCS